MAEYGFRNLAADGGTPISDAAPLPVTLAAGSAAVGSLTAGEAHIGQVQTIEAAAGMYLLYPQ